MPKHEKPLHWDMSFDEALRRVAQTDPRELPKPKRAKQKQKRALTRHKAVATQPPAPK
jgi:hypothetical protein